MHAEGQQQFPAQQSAHMSLHSTDTTLVVVRNDIIVAVDAGDVSAFVMLDLSAAFDTVDHAILIEVLDRRFGVHSTHLRGYGLSDRSQTAYVSANNSPTISLPCGLPQSSVIVPVVFITEEMNTTVQQERIDLHQFTDDGQMIAHGNVQQTSEICRMMEGSIVPIQDWCASRRLQLNPGKTELI
jgi:Reverse transcriptase (RNA-dependent DNA polymerase)